MPVASGAVIVDLSVRRPAGSHESLKVITHPAGRRPLTPTESYCLESVVSRWEYVEMPWTEPPTLDAATVASNRERARIRETIPSGWGDHHNMLTYGAGPGERVYGICGCRSPQVCLRVAGTWRHPYPMSPTCSNPPVTSHLI